MLSEYKAMWLFVIFDLPVTTKKARLDYTRFRKLLLKSGFTMLQFSVYARHCPTVETSETYKKRTRVAIPPEGHVRILEVTDKQFGKMENYYGKKRNKMEEPLPQLMLF